MRHARRDSTQGGLKQLRISAIALLVVFLGMVVLVAAPASAQQTCPPFTQGYWKNHYPAAWKDGTGLTLGTSFYTNAELEALFNTPVKGDASVDLAHQLIAALLNIANGTDGSPVAATIANANTLLGAGPIPENIKPSSPVGQKMTADAAVLDNYNNGNVTMACGVAQGSCQPSSSLSVLVSGTNVVGYIPKGNWSITLTTGIGVTNVEGSLVTPTLIPTANVVNSCASNSVSGQTVCTANNTDVYLLTGTTLGSTLTSSASGSITFSGGTCTNCGVAMDATHNKAVIALSLASAGGFQYLDLGGSPTFEPAFASEAPFGGGFPANISEDLLVDPIRNLILSPDEAANYELVNVATTTSPAFFENSITGTQYPYLDSAGEDCSTGIALAPVEVSLPSQVYLADLTQATFTSGSPGTWTAPSQVQTLSESVLSAGASGIAVAQGTHTGVVAGEFSGDAVTAIALPSTSGSGTPAITDWVTCSIGSGFQNGYDPHTVTAYKSPNVGPGDAIGVLANAGATTIAVVDLTKMLNPTFVPRTVAGHGCTSGTLPATVVSFISVP